MDGACPSEGARNSEDAWQTHPPPTSYPPPNSPSPATSPFLFRTSLIVTTPSASLILQDYHKTQSQEQALGSLAAVFRQSLQNKTSNTDFHQPSPPNLRPAPSPSPLPTITVLPASIQLSHPSQHSQDQTNHRKKKTAVIHHPRGSVAISDTLLHDLPLLRSTAATQSASTASSSALPAFAPNASRSQHQIFSSAKVVTPPVTPLALDVLHDLDASFQILNPYRSLQLSRTHRPGSEQQIYSDSISTNPESIKMSPPITKIFKRPRSKSEKQLNTSPISRSSGIPSSPPMSPSETLSMIHRSQSGTPVVVPELPASWGPFYQAGEGNPHSPLRNTSGIFNSSRIPPGPPPIDQSEIGGKFPSLSNGPGIERRVFIDPSYKRPQQLGQPAARPSHRRSVSLDRYELPVQGTRLRTEPPKFLDAALYNAEGFQQRPIVPDQGNPADTHHLLFEEFSPEKSTRRGILEKYSANGHREVKHAVGGGEDDLGENSKDLDEIINTFGEPNDELGDSPVQIDPRLSQWAWSPAVSMCQPSTPTKDTQKNALSRFENEPPTAPPTTPLPRLPFDPPTRQVRIQHEDSSRTGYSIASYDNTRNLLAMSSSPRDSTNIGIDTMDRLPVPPGSSISTSVAESMLDRLLSDSNSNNGLLAPPRPDLMRSSSDQSSARVSVIGSDGSMHSRGLSAHETSIFEQEVFARLRDSGILGESDERYLPQGRLSLEYLKTEDHEAVDPGPGTSQSSSVLSAARPGGPGIMRSGTPPLLFGSRAIGREESSITRQSSVGINGHLTMAARAVGLRNASRLGQAMGGEEDEQDWETVADSRGFSRRGLQDIEASAGAGSSLADFSDSSKLSAPKIPLQHVLVHPAHPRYQHSWNMLEDAQSGNLVLTPEYSGVSLFPNQNAALYRHPAPLPDAHSHPFGSPPPVIGSSYTAGEKESQIPPPVPMRSPARKMALSNLKQNVSGQTFTHDNDDWQTVDGGKDEDVQLPIRGGSFANVTVLGPRGNLTGTPQGTGTREVGSSLADASSPLDALNTLNAQTTKAQHRRTIDGSLDSVRANAPRNFQERINQHPLSSTESNEELSEHTFGSVPSEDLSLEVRQHRQHLVDNSLLPRLPTPPFTKPKRFSVPSYLLKSSNSANMVESASNVAQEGQGLMRMRSPHRGGQENDISTGIPTPVTLSALESLTQIPPRQQKKGTRRAGKAKVSDGESSPEAKRSATASRIIFEQPRLVPIGPTSSSARTQNQTRARAISLPRSEATASRVLFEQPRLFPDGAASSSVLHTGRGRTQNQTEHRASSQPRPEPRNANTMPGTANAMPGTANAMPRAPSPRPWTGPYGNFIHDFREPVRHPRPPIPAWRPVARAESPHLHRLPRPIGPDIEQREKELSRVFFALCCLIFPTLIIYGHGYMDGVIRQVSKGDFEGFRRQEKNVALCVGYGLMVPVAIVIAHVLWK